MKLQYQLSNGMWSDCDKRTEEFIQRCIKNRQRIGRNRDWIEMNREQVIAALEGGHKLRNDGSDWYSFCRCLEAHDRIIEKRLAAAPPVEMVMCGCGCTIPRGSVMSASLGSSCPDCYDRMSD